MHVKEDRILPGLVVPAAGYFAPKGTCPKRRDLARRNLKESPDYVASTSFRRRYARGDFAFILSHNTHPIAHWRSPPSSVDYSHYLPALFEGIAEEKEQLSLLACAAIKDLLEQKGVGDRILASVPLVVMPVTRSLNTRNPKTICRTLLALQRLLLSDPRIGPRLVPYYQHLLPSFSLLKSLNFQHSYSNKGRKSDAIEYGQRFKGNLDDLTEETLRLLEKRGGQGALAAIKFLVPTYTAVRF